MQAQRPDRKCGKVGCTNFGHFEGGYCHDHAAANRTAKTRSHAYLYNKRWDNLVATLSGIGNVCCQRIQADGTRCKRMRWAFHHIIGADQDVTLWYDWRNLVAVCQSCHPRPADHDQGKFVPTLWRTPMSDEPLPQFQCMPGERPPKDLVLWDVQECMRVLHRV